MKNEIKTFSIEIFEIKDGMVNLTKLCQANGKRLDVWMKTDNTKNFIEAINGLTLNGGSAIKVITSNNLERGTFGTREIAIKLAGRISPEFEVFCMKKLNELFSTGTTSLSQIPVLPQTYLQALKELVVKTEELEIAEARLSLISRTKKTYTASELGKEMGMRSAQEFNKWFSKYQYKRNDTWLLRAEYSGKGYDSIKTGVSQSGHTFHNLEFTQLGREWVLKLYTDEISIQYALN